MAPLAIHKHATQSVLSLYQEAADQYHSLLGENREYGGGMIGKQNKPATNPFLVLALKGICVHKATKHTRTSKQKQ